MIKGRGKLLIKKRRTGLLKNLGTLAKLKLSTFGIIIVVRSKTLFLRGKSRIIKLS
jgi:hypothetical protein